MAFSARSRRSSSASFGSNTVDTNSLEGTATRRTPPSMMVASGRPSVGATAPGKEGRREEWATFGIQRDTFN